MRLTVDWSFNTRKTFEAEKFLFRRTGEFSSFEHPLRSSSVHAFLAVLFWFVCMCLAH